MLSPTIRSATSSVLKGLDSVTNGIGRSLAPLDEDGARPLPDPLTKRVEELEQIVQRGPALTLADIPAYVDAVKNLNGVGLDDRKFLLEKLVTLMSRLPDGNPFSAKLQQFFIDVLYKDLPHPPGGYLSLPSSAASAPPPHKPYAARSADGSWYNPLFPALGMAGTPYARSVPSTMKIPQSALPDAGVLFDTLLARREFKPHPGGLSSLFFALANLIIHSCFHTNARDWTINDASSYLDLSPLYGNNLADVARVRRGDGTGRIWDDCFMDSRILMMPPSTNALLVIFSRNHNFIAEKLFAINEWGKYADPATLSDDAARQAQDDELFERARLVNTGFFMQTILRDYVGAILGCVRDGSAWRLDPLAAARGLDHEISPRGEGNVCSIEFNMLYRWHAAVSAQDERWTEDEFRRVFGGRDPKTITVEEFGRIARREMTPKDPDPRTWTFGGLQRGADGKYRDDDLAKILLDATEWPAGAFGAQNTPDVLRVVELLGIAQARSWGACSMNEFRSFMGLKPYSTFSEWNPDPSVHKPAEALYGHIDNLELHIGMQAEESKVPMPGAGMCPGYTISRAILSDAVCLTRGDRFLTTDCTPFNLTAWGYQDTLTYADDGSYGAMVAKMLFRTLPAHYPAGTAYGHFPFMVPGTMKQYLENRHEPLIDEYTWTRPAVPQPLIVVESYEGAKVVVGNPRLFAADYEVKLYRIAKAAAEDCALVNQVLNSDEALGKWGQIFYKTTEALLLEKSFKQVNRPAEYVDVVKDVINLVPVHVIANYIAGLPMKTENNPLGEYREQQLYDQFAEICNYVFVDSDPFYDWRLREHSKKIMGEISEYARGHLVKLTQGMLSLGGLSDTVVTWVAARNDHSDEFLKALLDANKKRGGAADVERLARALTCVVATSAHFSAALANVVDFYLDDQQAAARADIVQQATLRTTDAEVRLLHYAWEALVARPAIAGIYRTATAGGAITNGARAEAGQRVFVNLTAANAEAFANKEAGIFDVGEHGFMGSRFFDATAPQVLRAIFRLPGLQRAPGLSGQVDSFTETVHGTPIRSYVNRAGETTAFPPSLVVGFGA